MSTLREEAKWALAERLKEGKQVGRCTFRDLLDCEMNGERSDLLLADLDTLIRLDGGNDTRDGFAGTLMDKLIERYLEEHPELIAEEIAAIVHEEPEVA